MNETNESKSIEDLLEVGREAIRQRAITIMVEMMSAQKENPFAFDPDHFRKAMEEWSTVYNNLRK